VWKRKTSDHNKSRPRQSFVALTLLVLPAVLAGACGDSPSDQTTGSGGDTGATMAAATGGTGGAAPNMPKPGVVGDPTGCKETWNLLCEKACA